MLKSISIKTRLIIYLIIFIFYLSFTYKDIAKATAVLLSTTIVVISAMLFDFLFSYLKEKKFQVTESSVISGLIIGYVLSSDNRWWIFLLAAIFAVSSKHLIRIRNRHLFNPAALGIFLSIILLGANTEWKGAYLWYIVVPLGIYFTTKVRRLELLLGYFLSFFILFGVQAILVSSPNPSRANRNKVLFSIFTLFNIQKKFDFFLDK